MKDFSVPLSCSAFWAPHYICQSAWIEHAPFAFWLTEALQPKCFVELGSHYGYSYFAFCQAIERLGIGTAAYAVDTWEGDEHAGFYDNSVYESVLAINQRYAGFSRLNRATFAEAAEYFKDKSVDLIHIDGRHFYEDVKEDFEIWLPKLTDDAIVLFHDINVRERGFGVWKFFEELGERHRMFKFIHGNGLGVMALGKIPPSLAPLFDADDAQADRIRFIYSSLGGLLASRRQMIAKTEAIDEMLKDGADLSVNAAERFARIADWNPQVQRIRDALDTWRSIAQASQSSASEMVRARVAELEGALAELNEQLNQINAARESELAKTTDLRQTIHSLNENLRTSQSRIAQLEKDLSERDSQNSISQPLGVSNSARNGESAENNVRALLAEMVVRERRLIKNLSHENSQKDQLIASLSGPANEYHRTQHELNLIYLSTTWRVTAPLRHVLTKLPVVRTFVRRTMKGGYWTLTGQIFSRLAERRKALALIQAQQRSDSAQAQRDEDQASEVPPESARPVDIDYSIAVPFKFSTPPQRDPTRVGAIVHLYYEELAGELRAYLNNIPGAVDVYLSTADDFRASVIEKAFAGWDKGTVEVRVVKNRGRDVAPKLVSFKDVYDRHEYVLHFHGKRSKHADVLEHWRHFLLENLVGTPDVVGSIIYAFDRNPKLGIVAAQHFEPMRHWVNWGGNFPTAAALAKRMGFSIDERAPLDFPSGSIFWARTAALKPLLDLNLKTEDFDDEANQTDSTLAHAIERLYFYVAEHGGFNWIKISRPELFEHTPAIIGVGKDTDFDKFFERYAFHLLDPKGVEPRVIMPPPITAPSARLLEYVQKRALGEHLDVRPDTKVVIGIVTYNNKPEELNLSVAAAITALKQVGLQSHEAVYLIDNGEGTAGTFDRDEHCVRLPSSGNVGFGAGHNQLMRAAFENDTDIYIALNPDGLLHPDAVKALIQMIEANGQRALVEAVQFPAEHPKPYDPYTFDTPWVSGACLAISRTAYMDLDGFDDDFFMYCEDVDLSWRAKATGYALKTCARALFLHGVTNRTMAPHVQQMIFESGVILARKWGAPEFETWLKGEMVARSLKMPIATPVPVPKEWRKVTDFAHHFSFAQPRW